MYTPYTFVGVDMIVVDILWRVDVNPDFHNSQVPTSHTCGGILNLPNNDESFIQLSNVFNSVLSSQH